MTSYNILLTGSSSGMGKLIATELASKGHRVFASMRDPARRNAATARELAALAIDPPITPVEIDVTDDASVQRGVEDVLAQAGHIDVLINCAGIMWTGPSEAFAVDQFEAMVQTNLIGPFRMLKAVLPGMRNQGRGLAMAVTSLCGRMIPPAFSLYCASKFGLEALAEGMGYEVADFGIETVIIEPGAFATNLLANQARPADDRVAALYTKVAAIEQGITSRMDTIDPALVDPQQVADLVRELIEMPHGTRPLRVTVGNTRGLAALNAEIGRTQGEMLIGMGVPELVR